MSPSAAENALRAGWTHIIYGDLTKGTKNKIQAQNPDHNNCSMKSTVTIIAHYRPGREVRDMTNPPPSASVAGGPAAAVSRSSSSRSSSSRSCSS